MLYYYYYYFYSYILDNYRYKRGGKKHCGWILEDFSVNNNCQTNITSFFLFIQTTTDENERAGGSF